MENITQNQSENPKQSNHEKDNILSKANETVPPQTASGEYTTTGGVVVPFDKINEIISEKQTKDKHVSAAEPPTPAGKAQSDKPPKADVAKKPETGKGKGGKPKAPNKTKAPGKSEAPPAPAAPEKPAEPRDASRPGGPEKIVVLNLSELHPFKNHPFGVRDDAEMKALVESVRENGVMDKVDAVMEQLEASKYKRGGELIAWLRGKVDAMAFEDIAGMEAFEIRG